MDQQRFFSDGLKFHPLIDAVRVHLKLKSDAAVAKLVGATAPMISRARNHNLISDDLLLVVHELDPEFFTIRKLKALRKSADPIKEAA